MRLSLDETIQQLKQEKNHKQETNKLKHDNEESLKAMIKIWDLTSDLPNCRAKDEIIRIAGSVIYKDN